MGRIQRTARSLADRALAATRGQVDLTPPPVYVFRLYPDGRLQVRGHPGLTTEEALAHLDRYPGFPMVVVTEEVTP